MHMAAGITRSMLVLIVGLVCLGVVMQMLGTTMTLWDFTYQLDPINAPLLEGFSLPASAISVQSAAVSWRAADHIGTLHPVLREQVLFRPPNPLT